MIITHKSDKTKLRSIKRAVRIHFKYKNVVITKFGKLSKIT